MAAYKGELQDIKTLIENGIVNINERDDHGSTPAHKAAGQGHVAVLRWLIETGCDLSIKNGAGETPKDVARRFAQLGCLRLMGIRGDSDEEDEEGVDTARRLDFEGGVYDGESGSGVKLGSEEKKRARARSKKKIEDLERLLDIAKKNYQQRMFFHLYIFVHAYLFVMISVGGLLKEEKEEHVQRVQDEV